MADGNQTDLARLEERLRAVEDTLTRIADPGPRPDAPKPAVGPPRFGLATLKWAAVLLVTALAAAAGFFLNGLSDRVNDLKARYVSDVSRLEKRFTQLREIVDRRLAQAVKKAEFIEGRLVKAADGALVVDVGGKSQEFRVSEDAQVVTKGGEPLRFENLKGGHGCGS